MSERCLVTVYYYEAICIHYVCGVCETDKGRIRNCDLAAVCMFIEGYGISSLHRRGNEDGL